MLYTNEQRVLTAQRLQDLRIEKDLTFQQLQHELSKTCASAYPSVDKLKELEMQDESKPGFRKGKGTRIDYLCTLADFYGVSVSYLIGETDVRKPDANMQAASAFTGLSEKSIKELRQGIMYNVARTLKNKPILINNECVHDNGTTAESLEPSPFYTNIVNDILEKTPELLSALVQYVYSDSFEEGELIYHGKKYHLQPDATEKILLDNVKSETCYLKQRVHEKETPKGRRKYGKQKKTR